MTSHQAQAGRQATRDDKKKKRKTRLGEGEGGGDEQEGERKPGGH